MAYIRGFAAPLVKGLFILVSVIYLVSPILTSIYIFSVVADGYYKSIRRNIKFNFVERCNYYPCYFYFSLEMNFLFVEHF